ncbi:MAG: M3 family metallopeptidase [Woeseia sp.]
MKESIAKIFVAAFCVTTVAACDASKTVEVETAHAEINPLLADWTGPYGGVPAFDRMVLSDLKPALERGMEMRLVDIDLIASNPEAPTFQNTILALEREGEMLDRALTYYGIWRSSLSTPEFRDIQEEMTPRLAAHFTSVIQNEAQLDRVRAVYESDEMQRLRPDQQRLVQLVYDRFAANGAALEGEAKARYAEIDERLAGLYTQFANNVLADEEKYVLCVSDDQLGGLPASFVQAARAAGEERCAAGEYAITNTRSSMDPFLTYSEERGLREKVWRSYYNRGDNGDENDNNAVISRILELRHERVALLGYDNYAEWRLEDRMAETPENAFELLHAVLPAALARVDEEIAHMQSIADTRGDAIEIEAWDYRYYAELVRRDRYQLDSDEVKQYLQLDKLREAMFYVAGELFGFAFAPVPDGSVPVFHPDVKVWEVTHKASGDHVGLWYLDPFARPGKRSGAWASSYRNHSTWDGRETVLTSNNSNFIKGETGKPVRISWDDAETYFHEFGHALHALSSNVAYPTLNSGVRDYTEFQSQLLERWLATEPVIQNYLVHWETGEPIPDELVEKIRNAATFNQGFQTTEYLASALVDMMYHTADPSEIDPDSFERKALAQLGIPRQIPMRHRSTQFGHIFSGEGYSAGYYGYMWADVLTADAAEAFAEASGGFYDEDVAARLVDYLFAPRNSLDPAEAYRLFRGRGAAVEALMRDRGFAAEGT